MPKRSAEDKIEYYQSKIKKLRKRKTKKPTRNRVIVYSSSSNSDENSDKEIERMGENNDETRSPPVQVIEPSYEAPLVLHEETAEPAPELNAEPAPELNPELLEALGDAMDDIPIYGPDIHSKLAQRWLPILKKGIPNEAKEKLLKEYSIPDNCRLLKAPTLNAEISAAVPDIVRSRDKKIQAKQDQLGRGITAINKAMTVLLTGEDKIQAVKILSDGCRILTDLHFIETQVRTKLILPGLDKAFLTLIQDQDRDETLFGNKLPEKIKASKAIEKQGLQIKKVHNPKASPAGTSTSVTRSQYQGNWSTPPRYPPPTRRGGRSFSHNPYRTPAPQTYRRAPPTPTTAPSARPPQSAGYNKRAPAKQ